MRVIFLIDRSTDGANTDFGTVGEVTLGGTFTLLVLTTIAGVIAGVIYVALRRWLPFPGVPRGVIFGLTMLYGPGTIAISEIDLQLVDPALVSFAMLGALVILYGIGVALLIDRLHAPPAVRPGPRMERVALGLIGLVAAGVVFMAVASAYRTHDNAGTCLSVDHNTGKCAARPVDGG